VLDARVDVVDGLGAVAAADEGVDEVAGDRAGADDGDLHGEVVEVAGQEAGKRGHLGAALDLEDAHGVGGADFFVGERIVGRDVAEGADAGVAAGDAELDGVLHRGHHAEAEEVDFDDAEIFAVVFVPLADTAVGHGGGLEGDDFVELALADDHAAGVLAEVAGQAVELAVKAHHGLGARVVGGDAGHAELLLQLEGLREIAVGVEAGEAVKGVGAEAEDFADLAHDVAAAVGDDVCGHSGAAAAVARVDLLMTLSRRSPLGKSRSMSGQDGRPSGPRRLSLRKRSKRSLFSSGSTAVMPRT